MLKIQNNVIQVTCCLGNFCFQRAWNTTLISPDGWPSMAFFSSSHCAQQRSFGRRKGRAGDMLSDTFDLLLHQYSGLNSQGKWWKYCTCIFTHMLGFLIIAMRTEGSPSCAFCYVTHLSPKSVPRVCQVKPAHGLWKPLQINRDDIVNYDPVLFTNNSILH